MSPFFIGKHEVSNERFKAFVEATGYVTEAEKFGNSFVVEQFISKKVSEGINSAVVRFEATCVTASLPLWVLPADRRNCIHCPRSRPPRRGGCLSTAPTGAIPKAPTRT